MAGLSFSFNDLYPNYHSGSTTRVETVPEAEDQNTLVDDELLASKTQMTVRPETHRGVWLVLLGLLVFMIFNGMK